MQALNKSTTAFRFPGNFRSASGKMRILSYRRHLLLNLLVMMIRNVTFYYVMLHFSSVLNDFRQTSRKLYRFNIKNALFKLDNNIKNYDYVFLIINI